MTEIDRLLLLYMPPVVAAIWDRLEDDVLDRYDEFARRDAAGQDRGPHA